MEILKGNEVFGVRAMRRLVYCFHKLDEMLRKASAVLL
jgi:hypothetical protein